MFESVADGFDALVEERHRGSKGTCVTAACLMFLIASDEQRQKFVDIVKLAEGRGLEGSVLDAARAELGRRRDGPERHGRKAS